MRPVHTLPLVAAFVLAAAALGGCQREPSAEEQRFLASLGDTSITVYPAYVRVGRSARFDAGSADRIAAFLRDEKLADVTRSDAQPDLDRGWHRNQSAMWRESCDAFAEFVQANPPQTEYALIAEYLKGAEQGAAGGVHVYVLTREGAQAFGMLLNSHHQVFRDVTPSTPDECTTAAIRELKRRLDAERPKAKTP
ncbi:MAG: hypothetical protein AB7Q17_07920 [Phycisphaerae bacterium]